MIYLNDQPVMENDEVLHQMYLMSEEDMYPKSMKVKDVFHWTDEFYGCFNMEKAKELAKKEIQEGLIKACDVIDLIIEILKRASRSKMRRNA